jgi:hypothetical protein
LFMLGHTFASRLVMAGVDLKIVQELMGNKTIVLTAGYAYLASTHELKAFETLVRPRRLPVQSGIVLSPSAKMAHRTKQSKYTSSC